jgi:FkbM family methyltransferase
MPFMIQSMAQFVLDKTLSTRGISIGAKLARRALLVARKGLQRYDPLVTYRLGGFELRIPFSHSLPYHQVGLPDYSMNIGRIVEGVKARYTDLRVIDIGANIGDTAAIVRGHGHCPILCIEGDEQFFSLLEHNLDVLGDDVQVAKCFVGQGDFVAGSVLKEGGTARLEVGTKGTVQTQRLTEILAAHPEFRTSKILKVDTDGFDVQILRSSYDWISMARPVVFFEYDPFLLSRNGTSDPVHLFQELFSIGYRSAIIYDNTGEYLLTLPLDNQRLVNDVHTRFTGWEGSRYADVCAFHAEDDDLCTEIGRTERAHFLNRRGQVPF